MSDTLKLVLKKKWYQMIASGEKPEEYREITDYWGRRLTRHYDEVTFYLGYAKERPSMTYEVREITVGTGNPAWGAEPGRKYYIIKLGQFKNV